ncbi:hypothetical protein GWI33_013333, partial [Rhynchophorus ferrugineus]
NNIGRKYGSLFGKEDKK